MTNFTFALFFNRYLLLNYSKLKRKPKEFKEKTENLKNRLQSLDLDLVNEDGFVQYAQAGGGWGENSVHDADGVPSKFSCVNTTALFARQTADRDSMLT